jgi:hypothetical protein
VGSVLHKATGDNPGRLRCLEGLGRLRVEQCCRARASIQRLCNSSPAPSSPLGSLIEYWAEPSIGDRHWSGLSCASNSYVGVLTSEPQNATMFGDRILKIKVKLPIAGWALVLFWFPCQQRGSAHRHTEVNPVRTPGGHTFCEPMKEVRSADLELGLQPLAHGEPSGLQCLSPQNQMTIPSSDQRGEKAGQTPFECWRAGR